MSHAPATPAAAGHARSSRKKREQGTMAGRDQASTSASGSAAASASAASSASSASTASTAACGATEPPQPTKYWAPLPLPMEHHLNGASAARSCSATIAKPQKAHWAAPQPVQSALHSPHSSSSPPLSSTSRTKETASSRRRASQQQLQQLPGSPRVREGWSAANPSYASVGAFSQAVQAANKSAAASGTSKPSSLATSTAAASSSLASPRLPSIPSAASLHPPQQQGRAQHTRAGSHPMTYVEVNFAEAAASASPTTSSPPTGVTSTSSQTSSGSSGSQRRLFSVNKDSFQARAIANVLASTQSPSHARTSSWKATSASPTPPTASTTPTHAAGNTITSPPASTSAQQTNGVKKPPTFNVSLVATQPNGTPSTQSHSTPPSSTGGATLHASAHQQTRQSPTHAQTLSARPTSTFCSVALHQALGSSTRHSSASSLHSSRGNTPHYTSHSSPDSSQRNSPRGAGAHSPLARNFTRSAPASPAQTRSIRKASMDEKLQREKCFMRQAESLRSLADLDDTDLNASTDKVPFSLLRASSLPVSHCGRLRRSSSPQPQPHARSLNSSFDRLRTQDDTNHHRRRASDGMGDEDEEEEGEMDDETQSEPERGTDELESAVESVVESDVDAQLTAHDSSYLGSASDDQRASRSASLTASDTEGEDSDAQLKRAPIRASLSGRGPKKRRGGAGGTSTTASATSASAGVSPGSSWSGPGPAAAAPAVPAVPEYKFSNLHMQIEEISSIMGPNPKDDLIRRGVSKRVSEAVWELWPDAEVHIIGSCATNLFLPDSDIDLVIRNPHGKPKLDVHDLYVLGEHLTPLSSKINIISTASVPLIKCVDKLTNYTVDLTLNVETGLYSTSFVIQQLDRYPEALHRLTIVLKQFLKAKGLNDLYSGGLPSYTLILMIVSFLQNHPPEQQRQMLRQAITAEEEKNAHLHQTMHAAAPVVSATSANGGDSNGDAHGTASVPLRTQLRKGDQGERKSSSASSSTAPANDSVSALALAALSVPVDLGDYLLAFLHLYSVSFSYETLGISLVSGYFAKASRGWLHPHNPQLLCLENPMDPTIDLGFKVFNYAAIRSAFLDAYELLKSGKGFGGATTEPQQQPVPDMQVPLASFPATYPPPSSANQSPFLSNASSSPAMASMPILALQPQPQPQQQQIGRLVSAPAPHAFSPATYSRMVSTGPSSNRASPNFDLSAVEAGPGLLPYPAAALPYQSIAAPIYQQAAQVRPVHQTNGKHPPLPHKAGRKGHAAQHAQ